LDYGAEGFYFYKAKGVRNGLNLDGILELGRDRNEKETDKEKAQRTWEWISFAEKSENVFFCVSVYLSVCLSVCLHVCLSVCLSSVCLFIRVCVCVCVRVRVRACACVRVYMCMQV